MDPVDSPETPVKKINMKSGALEETELSAVNIRNRQRRQPVQELVRIRNIKFSSFLAGRQNHAKFLFYAGKIKSILQYRATIEYLFDLNY